MLFLIILFLLANPVFTTDKNVGSVLFYQRSSEECWSPDDLAKLHARKIFEKTLLPSPPPDKINSKCVKETLKYFRRATRMLDKSKDPYSAKILKEALSDTIGGHLRHEILPNARFAYYAGYIPYKSIRQLHNYYENLKFNLNTQGTGWRPPERMAFQSNLTVGKILIGTGKFFDPCSLLSIKRDDSNCIHIPTPQVDNEAEPSALALPFKSGGLISLTAPDSENVLLKYYTTAGRCILRSSPAECRHSDFVNFNNELWHWMKRNVAPHLLDEKLYAAYGGILRIAAAVQNYGKGLSRRNLYDLDDFDDDKWHPLRKLNQKFYIDADWTPQLYISIVMGTALAICCLHICLNIVFGRANGCRCPGSGQRRLSAQKDIAYAHVDSNFPAMLPQHVNPISDSHDINRSKSASVGTIRTQKVYDLNENAEKLMSVIMSDNETEIESSSSKDTEDETLQRAVRSSSIQTDRKSTSPPKIAAPVTQLRIEKAPNVDRSRQMYSTSTVTQSEVTYRGQVSDTVWSGSYSTDHTASSTSTKSRTQRSRRSRDLAWARRVISKQNVHDQTTKSTTGTDVDVNSFITPPSRK